jgi:hypothetical protein
MARTGLYASAWQAGWLEQAIGLGVVLIDGRRNLRKKVGENVQENNRLPHGAWVCSAAMPRNWTLIAWPDDSSCCCC